MNSAISADEPFGKRRDYVALDLIGEPARLSLVAVTGKKFSIKEIIEFERGPLFHLDERADPNDEISQEESVTDTPTLMLELQSRIKQALAKFSEEELPTAVILPGKDVFNLTLELPFADRKTLDRVIVHEVNDYVPFDVEEFFLSYRSVSGSVTSAEGAPLNTESKSHGKKVLVSGIPRAVVEIVLAACRGAGIEPLLLLSPSGALGGVPLVLGDPLMEQEYAVVAHTRDLLVVTSFISSLPVREQILPLTRGFNEALSHLRISLLETFSPPKANLERLYFVTPSSNLAGATQAQVSFMDLGGDPWALGAVALLRYPERAADVANFRTGEFSYNPGVRYVLEGLYRLAPAFVSTILVIALVLCGIYVSRKNEIASLQEAISSTIRSNVPGIVASPGEERALLNNVVISVKNQLQQLGNQGELTPLDTLYEIADHFPTGSGVRIRSISINDKVRIEAEAPDYPAIEKVQEQFRKRRKIFCKVKSNLANSFQAGGRSMRTFSLDIKMCE